MHAVEQPRGQRVRVRPPNPMPLVLALAIFIAGTASRGEAQNARQRADARARAAAASEPAPPPVEPTLVFEREVFLYSAAGRRDPFTSLTGELGVRPRFEAITLRGVIHSPVPGESVAILGDTDGKVYRARRGDVVGEARVLDIAPDRVRFAVTTFGVVRQEQLELKTPGAASAASVANTADTDSAAAAVENHTDAAEAAGANE